MPMQLKLERGEAEMDWEQARLRYVAGNVSYSALAKAYGVSASAVKARGTRENWVQQRAHYRQQRQLQEKPEQEEALRVSRFLDVTDRLLEKVAQLTAQEDTISAANLKTLSDVMKNIKEVQMIRSHREILEQDAKIEKLRKDLGRQEQAAVTVTLEGVEEFAG